jgi:hypothetical protein
MEKTLVGPVAYSKGTTGLNHAEKAEKCPFSATLRGKKPFPYISGAGPDGLRYGHSVRP